MQESGKEGNCRHDGDDAGDRSHARDQVSRLLDIDANPKVEYGQSIGENDIDAINSRDDYDESDHKHVQITPAT